MVFVNYFHVLLAFSFLSCHTLEADARFADLYPNFVSILNNTKRWISEFVSELEIPVPPLYSFTSLYLKGINQFMLIADDVVSGAYGNLKTVINKSDDIVTRFRSSSFWQTWPYIFSMKHDFRFNATAFDLDIKEELYGQHIAAKIVTEHLKKHLFDDNPKKPLVMSFHGQTGCGKSFLSKIIAKNLFMDGTRSKCVHFYYGSLDFPSRNRNILYKKKLMYEIPLYVQNCERSLFIFEEVDKMVPGVIDILVPFLEFGDGYSYVDFRKSIFIFLSNSGGKRIAEITYNAWFDGHQREEITLENVSSHLEEAAYYGEGGLQQSEIVKSNLIDSFVPFIPLEKKQVKQCIVREFQQRKIPHDDEVIEKVSNQLQYEPPGFEIYSVSGCKKISHKVDLFWDNES